MQHNPDTSASGYLTDSFEGIGRTFTDVETLSTSSVNVVARAKRFGRWWLLKGLQPEVASEAAYQQRLRKELDILMQLQHPGVVGASGLEDVEGLGPCIVMEYVDGLSLEAWLNTNPTRTARRQLANELAEAVGYVHSKGIVHRDLKPANIMVTRNGGNVKLIDFGLADTDSHAVLKQPAGTLRYMSPEQAQQPVPDVRNDIYSLGIVFSQMNLGLAYRPLIRKCQKPRNSRYHNIQELLNDMERLKTQSRAAWLMTGVIAVGVVGAFVLGNLPSANSDGAPAVNNIPEVSTAQSDSTVSMPRPTADATAQQGTAPTGRQRMDEAISQGRRYISQRIQQTRMAEHMDTLSSVLYLRRDFAEVIQKGSTWVEEYMQGLKEPFSTAEAAEIRSALNDYVGQETEKWSIKFMQLKKEYDQSLMP